MDRRKNKVDRINIIQRYKEKSSRTVTNHNVGITSAKKGE